MTLTPPARHNSLSPVRRLCTARWTAARDDEHALSIVRLGPRKPKAYEIRPGTGVSTATLSHIEIDGLRIRENSSFEIAHPLSDKDADARSVERRHVLSGVLERLPGRFQQQPLLRIEALCFPGRDFEKLRIELVDAVQKPSPLADRLPGNRRTRIKEAIEIDARGGNFGDGVTPSLKSRPQALDVGDAAGETTANPNNRDRAVAGGRCGCRSSQTLLKSRSSDHGAQTSRYFCEKRRALCVKV